MNCFFFDTYAFFEIIAGNKNYYQYTTCKIVTTRLNLMELYYGLILSDGIEAAEKKYEELIPFTIDVDDATIKSAMQFRAEHRKQKLSYADCIGYTTAKRLGIKILTGDKEFKYLDNVEFVV